MAEIATKKATKTVATKKSASKKATSKKTASKKTPTKKPASAKATSNGNGKGKKQRQASPLTNADPNAVVTVKTKAGHRGKVFGNSTVNFVRWLGSLGCNVALGSAVCRKFKVEVAIGTLRISLTQGRNKKFSKQVKEVTIPPKHRKTIEAMVRDGLKAAAK